jgi:hypothetical protein
MFGVKLHHCWVVDPRKSYAIAVLKFGDSYNSFMNSYTSRKSECQKNYSKPEDFDAYNEEMCNTEPAVTWFLNNKSTQCTGYGIEQIKTNLDGFAVLFKVSACFLISRIITTR